MMLFLYNFLTFFLLSFPANSQTLAADGQPIMYPRQIVHLSSDPRVLTNALLADKSKRQLSLFDSASLLKGSAKEQFSIDIGKNTGDKKKRDDRRTPEGMYILLERKTPPEIPFVTYGSLAFTTNYPNYFDKVDNKTGSGIWLHAVPDKVPLTRGSKGCVVLRNDDIKKLEPSIILNKTFLIIDSQIQWVSSDDHAKEKQLALDWLEQWRAKWEKQDIDAYIENYSVEFAAPGFNRKSWFEHKKKLKDRYTYVKVATSEPNVFQMKKQYIIQFVQNYESDGHKDMGIKTLYLLKEGNSLRIKREEWAELSATASAN